MARHTVFAQNAPRPIGPYSQAIVAAGSVVYAAGQIGIVPATGEIVAGGIKEQTRQVLENLGAVLGAAGSGFQHVLKTTVYLRDMTEFGAMNEIYAQFFSESPPARTTVEVSRLPRDVRVEIDAVALVVRP